MDKFEFEIHPIPDINLAPTYGTVDHFHVKHHEKQGQNMYDKGSKFYHHHDHFNIGKKIKDAGSKIKDVGNSAGKGITNANIGVKTPSASTFKNMAKKPSWISGAESKASNLTHGFNVNSINKGINWDGGKGIKNTFDGIGKGISKGLTSKSFGGLDDLVGGLLSGGGSLAKGIGDSAGGLLSGTASALEKGLWAGGFIIIMVVVGYLLYRTGALKWMTSSGEKKEKPEEKPEKDTNLEHNEIPPRAEKLLGSDEQASLERNLQPPPAFQDSIDK
jgi:hypothetical protein